MSEFLKKAILDMKDSAKTQHEIDKANFDAIKIKNQAQWEDAKNAPFEKLSERKIKKAEELAQAQAKLAEAEAYLRNTKEKCYH